MYNKEPILILFAKKPVLGKVKTRLCPPLSSSQAKDVASFLIKKSVENLSAHWPGKIDLCVWPDSNDTIFAELNQCFNITLSNQVSGDLGEKMRVALAQNLQKGHNAMVMGIDVPHCSKDILNSAYEALKADKNVIGPTHDGGYYCIGVTKTKPSMFENVQWGSKMAYSQTLLSCAAAKICFDSILPSLDDLDTFEDLLKISKQMPELRNFIDEKIH